MHAGLPSGQLLRASSFRLPSAPGWRAIPLESGLARPVIFGLYTLFVSYGVVVAQVSLLLGLALGQLLCIRAACYTKTGFLRPCLVALLVPTICTSL